MTDHLAEGNPMATHAEPEIWFLTGSQAMYGEDTLRQVAEQSRQIAAALHDSPQIPARVVWKPVLTTSGDILRVCRDAAAQGPSG